MVILSFVRILGIDCSSTTIGLGILEVIDNNIKFIDVFYFKPPKNGNIFARLKETQIYIKSTIEKYKIDIVAIEEFAKFFGSKSSANTIIALALFNRFVGMAAYEQLGTPPTMLNVMSIRHAIKLTKQLPPKEDIPYILEKRLNITFPFEYKKSGKIKEDSYDMADGLAVALAAAMKKD